MYSVEETESNDLKCTGIKCNCSDPVVCKLTQEFKRNYSVLNFDT